MSRDIDAVIVELKGMFPGIACEQLRVAHPGADDDGLWFFTHANHHGEVQLESSTGNVPFMVEGDDSDTVDLAGSTDEAITLVVARLGLREGDTR